MSRIITTLRKQYLAERIVLAIEKFAKLFGTSLILLVKCIVFYVNGIRKIEEC